MKRIFFLTHQSGFVWNCRLINDIFSGRGLGYWLGKTKRKTSTPSRWPQSSSVDYNRNKKIRFYTVGRAFLCPSPFLSVFVSELRGRLTTLSLLAQQLAECLLYNQLTPANDHQSRTVRYKLLKRSASGCSWLFLRFFFGLGYFFSLSF